LPAALSTSLHSSYPRIEVALHDSPASGRARENTFSADRSERLRGSRLPAGAGTPAMPITIFDPRSAADVETRNHHAREVMSMLIETYATNGFQILKVKDPVNLGTDLADIRRLVDEYLGKGLHNIALSFTPDSYFYTKHISILVQCLERIKEAGGRLAVINPNDDILDVLKTIGFLDLTSIYKSEAEIGS
jgi:anti-anti-sigma regulatory factor